MKCSSAILRTKSTPVLWNHMQRGSVNLKSGWQRKLKLCHIVCIFHLTSCYKGIVIVLMIKSTKKCSMQYSEMFLRERNMILPMALIMVNYYNELLLLITMSLYCALFVRETLTFTIICGRNPTIWYFSTVIIFGYCLCHWNISLPYEGRAIYFDKLIMNCLLTGQYFNIDF